MNQQLTKTIGMLAECMQSLSSQVGALSYQIPNFIKFFSEKQTVLSSKVSQEEKHFDQDGA